MPLHTTYRPANLDDLVGNDGTIESLISVLDRESDIPHSFLFTGPSGTGKSSCANILKNELKCSESDYYLYNAASARGIDVIREIIENSSFMPIDGDVKLIVLEECFSKNTEILMYDESKKYIQDVIVGDKIKNLNGIDEVEKTFINKVPLERIIKIQFYGGKTIICSKEHLFLTNEKNNSWTMAKELDKGSFLCYHGNEMQNIISQGDTEDGQKNISKNMQRVQEKFYGTKERGPILFKQLCKNIQKQGKSNIVRKEMQIMWNHFQKQGTKCTILSRMQNKTNNDLRRMWKKLLWYSCKRLSFLFPNMCWEMEKYATRISKNTSFRGTQHSNKSRPKTFPKGEQGKIFRNNKSKFRKNEEKESNVRQENSGKNVTNKAFKWYSTYMEWYSWWKWTIYRSTNATIPCTTLAYGSSGIIGKTSEWVSNKLQNRYCKRNVKDWGRSRWQGSPMACKESKGQEKRKEISRIRVENIEIYKQGNNDGSFEGSIGDKERDQGFIELYDFQVKSNPSYIANGCYVHNCHQLTVPAQESLLVILEEPPKQLFFVLCTTEPSKLKPTIKRRCHHYELKALIPQETKKLLNNVLKNEGVENYPKEIIQKISEVCDGSPGKALNLLDTVIDIENSELALQTLEDSTVSEANIAEIISMLRSGRDEWQSIATKIKGLSGEAESLRYAFLNYLQKVLLSKGTSNIASLMMPFMETCQYTGAAGLTFAIYTAWLETKN